MLNSAGKTPFAMTQGLVISGVGVLIKVYWFNPGSPGDTFVLTNAATGAILLQGRCEVAGQSQLFDQTNGLAAEQFNGLGCSQLSSGTLLVTID
jgi:hypothetical protein